MEIALLLYMPISRGEFLIVQSHCPSFFRNKIISPRRKLGKLRILDLIQNLTSPEMNCYVDIIPTGTSDIDVIRVFKSYVNIPALILTSDKELYMELFGHSVFVQANRGNTIRIVTEATHYVPRSFLL